MEPATSTTFAPDSFSFATTCRTNPGGSRGPWRRSDVQEAAEADAGPDRADDGAAAQQPDADRARVPRGHEETLEEALGRVELAQQVLEREDAADG